MNILVDNERKNEDLILRLHATKEVLTIEKVLQRGTFGDVYFCFDSTKKPLVVKVTDPISILDELDYQERKRRNVIQYEKAQKETKFYIDNRHPNIIQGYGFDAD